MITFKRPEKHYQVEIYELNEDGTRTRVDKFNDADIQGVICCAVLEDRRAVSILNATEMDLFRIMAQCDKFSTLRKALEKSPDLPKLVFANALHENMLDALIDALNDEDEEDNDADTD